MTVAVLWHPPCGHEVVSITYSALASLTKRVVAALEAAAAATSLPVNHKHDTTPNFSFNDEAGVAGADAGAAEAGAATTKGSSDHDSCSGNAAPNGSNIVLAVFLDLGLAWVVVQLAAAELGWIVFNLPDPRSTPNARIAKLLRIAAKGSATSPSSSADSQVRSDRAVMVLAESNQVSMLDMVMQEAGILQPALFGIDQLLRDHVRVDPNTWKDLPMDGQASGMEPDEVAEGKSAGHRHLMDQLPHPFIQTALPAAAAAAAATRCSHIFFTSGTTGEPKPVATTACGLAAYAGAAADRYQIGTNDKVMIATAPVFDPSVGDLVMALAAGATVCVAPWINVAVNLAECLQTFGATHVCTTPAIWATIECSPSELPLLRNVVLGGDFMPAATVALWAESHVDLYNTYGVTEATVYQFANLILPCDAGLASVADRNRKLIGNPFASVQYKVYSEDGAEMQNTGDVGELWLFGKQLTSCWPPSSNAPCEHTGRLHRTGDWVTICRGGKLALHGRTDNQVKVNGQRLALEEVEAAACAAAPEIVSGCVCRVRDGNKLEVAINLQSELKRACTKLTNSGSAATTVALDERANRQLQLHADSVDIIMVAAIAAIECVLPRAFVPLRCAIAKEWFMLPTGKVDRKGIFSAVDNAEPQPYTMSSWYWQYTSSSVLTKKSTGSKTATANVVGSSGSGSNDLERTPPSPPWTLMETTVAAVWAAVMEVDVSIICRSSTLADLGGDSLSVLRVVRKLHDALGVEIDLRSAKGRVGELAGALAPSAMLQTPRLDAYSEMLERELGPVNEHATTDGASSRGDADDVVAPMRLLQTPTAAETEENQSTLHPQLFDQARLDAALHGACGSGLHGPAAVLLRCRADPCGGIGQRDHGYSPLHAASKHGHSGLVKLLLQNGARTNVTTAARLAPAHCAAGGGYVQVLEQLLTAGCPPRMRDSNKQGLLHHAARHGQADTCRYLLAPPFELSIHALDRWHRTPLHWAVVNSHPATVQSLLDNGANPNFAVRASVHQKTSTLLQEPILHTAVRNASGSSTAAVPAAGGRTAESNAHLQIVEFLLAAGAAKNAVDENGATAFAVCRGMVEAAAKPFATNSTVDRLLSLLDNTASRGDERSVRVAP